MAADRAHRRWWALGLLCTAFFMDVLGSTIVYTAVPSIAADLGLAVAGAQWVFTAYALTYGGLLLAGGRTADLLGRRRVFMAGIAGFAVASMLCGLATAGWVLIGARVVQGAAAAVMSPAALSLLTTTFTAPAERNRALGVWSAVGGTGATAGLLVGGVLVDGPGWRWVFFLNVPLCAAMLALAPVLLTESTERATRLLPLRLLRSRTLLGGNAVMLVAGMAVDGMLFTLTLYAQGVLGWSAVAFGLAVAVMTLASVAGSWAAQRAATRAGFRPVAAAGMVLLAGACTLLTGVSPGGGFARDLLPGLVLFGLGMGAAFVAGSIASLAGVRAEDSGAASGLQNTSFNLGTALGVALLSTVAVARTGALRRGPAAPGELTSGYAWAFGVAAVLCGLGLLAALLLLRDRPPAAAGQNATREAQGSTAD
jgi:MFS family permease